LIDLGGACPENRHKFGGIVSVKPLLEAACGRFPERLPVWFMRQAGRYLPEYMEVRKNVDFVKLCQTPELAAEVTLQPLRRYDVDASIIFSDILVTAMAMGQKLTFDTGHGPHLEPVIRSAQDLLCLKETNALKDLGYVGEAIGLVKQKLRPEQAMIGFCGAPFTVASYMVEGQGSKDYAQLKRMIYEKPAVLRKLLDKLIETTVDYLLMQVDAGADCVMVFDSWAGNLAPDDFREWAFTPANDLLKAMQQKGIPTIYYPGQGSAQLFSLQGLAADVVSIDWRIDLLTASKILDSQGLEVALQGNLDPLALIAPEEVLRKKVRHIIEQGRLTKRPHIFNLGHGLLPITPPESLNIVLSEIRDEA